VTPTNRDPIRLAAIGLTHEANTFAVGSVGIDEFRSALTLRGETLTRRHADAGTIMGGYLRYALLASYQPVVDRVVAAASPDRLPYRHRRTPLFPFEKDFTPTFQEPEP